MIWTTVQIEIENRKYTKWKHATFKEIPVINKKGF